MLHLSKARFFIKKWCIAMSRGCYKDELWWCVYTVPHWTGTRVHFLLTPLIYALASGAQHSKEAKEFPVTWFHHHQHEAGLTFTKPLTTFYTCHKARFAPHPQRSSNYFISKLFKNTWVSCFLKLKTCVNNSFHSHLWIPVFIGRKSNLPCTIFIILPNFWFIDTWCQKNDLSNLGINFVNK